MQNGGVAITNGVGAGGRVFVTTPGAARQFEFLSQNGLTPRWKVPM